MQRPLKDAAEITPLTQTKWCVLVQVVSRRKPKQKDDGPLFRNYVLADTKGTLVPMVMFDKTVAHFSHTLEPYKRYYLSNAQVKDTPERYKSLEYPYTWTLQRTNLVEPYNESIPPPIPCKFQLDKFSDFYRHADHDRQICVKALVMDILPIQQTADSAYRDVAIINEEMIPILVRIWDDVDLDADVNMYAKNICPPLIIAYGLNVSTQHGLSLRTKPSSYFMVDPPIIEEAPFKEWYDAHSAKIASLIQNRAYRDPAVLFHPPRPAEILPLTFAIATIKNIKATWTEGTITFIPGQQHIWYEACEKCLTKLDVDSDWKIFCSFCKEYTKVTVRYNFGVHLTHGTTKIQVSVKSPEVDNLLPFTANQTRLAAAANKPLTGEIQAALQGKHIICYLKYYEKESQLTVYRRYPVLKIYSEAEMHEYNLAQEKALLAAVTSEKETPMHHIGSSSTTPKTPANKEVIISTSQEDSEETGQMDSIGKIQQATHIGVKRRLEFDAPDASPTANQTIEKRSIQLNNPQEPDKAEEDQPTNREDSAPTKKTKDKGKET